MQNVTDRQTIDRQTDDTVYQRLDRLIVPKMTPEPVGLVTKAIAAHL